MFYDGKIYIGTTETGEKTYIFPKMANRHGMIAGATGTGKTITLKVLAESFSDAGVPVFLADVKGDLAGMCVEGANTEDMQSRIARWDLAEKGFNLKKYPTTFWDIYAEKGLPLRTTVSEMGPLLLARILGLNETQSAILKIIFKIADDENLLLIDSKDLRSMLSYVGENAKEYSLTYGNIAKQSISAIIRAVIALEDEGAEQFLGEPAVNVTDWITTDCNGKGMIQVLDCQKLILNPNMYATFMLWLMSELFETLPEVGDLDKPRMVFFFDEAHLLFDSAPASLLDKVEQVVKLIRSKGVGIYFITQNPQDIPDGILSQLGNKIQHALRAYTPADQKRAKAAAMSYRENPEFNTYDVLTSLGTGEALISVLDEKGIPSMVEKCYVMPPQSKMGAIDDATRKWEIESNMLYPRYSVAVDRDSAYEFLLRKNLLEEQEAAAEAERLAKEKEEEAERKAQEKAEEAERKAQEKAEEAERKQKEREEAAALKAQQRAEDAQKRQEEKEKLAAEKAAAREAEKAKNSRKRAVKGVASSAAGTVGRELGNAVGSSVGGKFGKKIGGNLGASLGRGIIGTLFKM